MGGMKKLLDKQAEWDAEMSYQNDEAFFGEPEDVVGEEDARVEAVVEYATELTQEQINSIVRCRCPEDFMTGKQLHFGDCPVAVLGRTLN